MRLTTLDTVIEYCKPIRCDLGFATDTELHIFLNRLIDSTSAQVLHKLNRPIVPAAIVPAVENIVLRLIQLELAMNVALKTSAITSFEELEQKRSVLFSSKKEIIAELHAYKSIPSVLAYERVMYNHD